YAILQKADLLKLKKDIDLVNVTQNDIIENKHNLEIQEMDSAQIPRALDDLDYGVIPGSIVYSSGLDPSLSLLDEDILEELELVATIDKKIKIQNGLKLLSQPINQMNLNHIWINIMKMIIGSF